MAGDPDPPDEPASPLTRLLEQLAATPAVDVIGVVSPRGAGGCKSRGEAAWTLSFDLDVWRIPPGDVQTRPLAVRQQVTEGDLDRLRADLAPYTVVRIRARISTGSLHGKVLALLETLTGTDTTDAELNTCADRMRQPVTFEDSRLGTFTLNRSVDWFTAQVEWSGARISLSLSAGAPADARALLATASSLWANRQEWDRRIRGFAAQELLAIKNERWLDEGEPELDAAEFSGRMEIEAITVNSDGSFDFWYADGDMFWGHAIQVEGNLSDGPTNTRIAG